MGSLRAVGIIIPNRDESLLSSSGFQLSVSSVPTFPWLEMSFILGFDNPDVVLAGLEDFLTVCVISCNVHEEVLTRCSWC